MASIFTKIVNGELPCYKIAPEKYKDAVLNVAKLCTVKRHLENPPHIDTIIT